MMLSPRPTQVTDFLWHPHSKMFTIDMSQLGHFGRIWDDACDVGLTLLSRYPGRKDIVFAVVNEQRDSEGDIQYWDLYPVSGVSPGFQVRVFNT